MKHNRNAFVICACLAAALVYFVCVEVGHAADGRFSPVWSSGQRWRVLVERWTEPSALPAEQALEFVPRRVTFVYECQVLNSVTLAGESCYCARIDCVLVNGKTIRDEKLYRIYVRKADYTLKLVERRDRRSDRIEATASFARGPVDATDWVGFLPMAFPSFQTEQLEDATRSRSVGIDEMNVKETERVVQDQERIALASKGKSTESLRITVRKIGGGLVRQQSTQVWQKGKPWWTEATHERNGRFWCSAILLDE